MRRQVVLRALRSVRGLHSGLLGLACLLACAPPGPAETPLTRLGFWNVRRLGLDTGKDVSLLCRLALRHFDVLGLVEIMADDATGDVAALRSCLSAELTLLETPAAAPAGSAYAEHAWLAVRPGHAAFCGEGALAPVDAAGFLRPPAFACLRVGERRALVLGVYHARWSNGDTAATARELSALPGALDAARSALARGGPADVALLGDLNLAPGAAYGATGLVSRTTGTGSTLGPTGELTHHLYDQLLLGPSTAIELTSRVLDLRDEAGGMAAYQRALSDHLPIVGVLGDAAPGERGQRGAAMP